MTLYEMTAYSDYTFFFLLAIGIFSIIVSVIGFDVGVILGGVGECVVTFIQFRRYFTEDFSSIPVELNIGFYILVFRFDSALAFGIFRYLQKRTAK